MLNIEYVMNKQATFLRFASNLYRNPNTLLLTSHSRFLIGVFRKNLPFPLILHTIRMLTFKTLTQAMLSNKLFNTSVMQYAKCC